MKTVFESDDGETYETEQEAIEADAKWENKGRDKFNLRLGLFFGMFFGMLLGMIISTIIDKLSK